VTPKVLQAIEKLRQHGATLAVESGTVRISYRCPASDAPKVARAISVLRANKPEVIALLSGWPSASFEAVEKFGTTAARLYPFIGLRVRTPKGTGKLLQVFVDRATVSIDGEEKTTDFQPDEINPWVV
jgi:hypothetical protein